MSPISQIAVEKRKKKRARNYFLAGTGLAGQGTRLGLALRARSSPEVAPACPVPALSPKAATETLAPIGSAGSISAISPRKKPRPAHTTLRYRHYMRYSTLLQSTSACVYEYDLAQGTIVAEEARKELARPCMAGIKG